MSLCMVVSHTVPFHDCDMMEIVWHGNHYRYFEMARSALMRSLAMDFADMKELGIAMPIVRTQADYRAPLIYGQRIAIEARILAPYSPALEIAYEIRDEAGIKVFARGVTKQVYVEHATRELLYVLPPVLEERMRAGEGRARGARHDAGSP
jgi:acyl-CoA thioester hydrolase